MGRHRERFSRRRWAQDDQYDQQPKRPSATIQEIHGADASHMIVQKKGIQVCESPSQTNRPCSVCVGCTWRPIDWATPRSPRPVAVHMDEGRAPSRLAGSSPDQVPDLEPGNFGRPPRAPRLPAPVIRKPVPMPSNNGFRLDNRDGVTTPATGDRARQRPIDGDRPVRDSKT